MIMQNRILEHHTSNYKDLSVVQVKSLPNISIRQGWEFWGFYGHSTINHDYNLKTIGGDKVIIDRATGLMWHKGGSGRRFTWVDAKGWIESLNGEGYAGYQDWRMPTLEEAVSLLEPSKKNGDLYIDPVFSKKQWNIHTGDQFLSKAGWLVFFDFGHVSGDNCYIGCYHYVRPVRSVR